MNKRVPTPARQVEAAVAPVAPVAPVAAIESAPPPTPAAPPAMDPPGDDGGDRIECRVLLAFGGHRANDLVTLSATELERWRGHVCDHPASVAFARSLQA